MAKVNCFNIGERLSENVLKFVLVDKTLDYRHTVFCSLKNSELFDMIDIIKAVNSHAELMNEYIEEVWFTDRLDTWEITNDVLIYL